MTDLKLCKKEDEKELAEIKSLQEENDTIARAMKCIADAAHKKTYQALIDENNNRINNLRERIK